MPTLTDKERSIVLRNKYVKSIYADSDSDIIDIQLHPIETYGHGGRVVGLSNDAHIIIHESEASVEGISKHLYTKGYSLCLGKDLETHIRSLLNKGEISIVVDTLIMFAQRPMLAADTLEHSNCVSGCVYWKDGLCTNEDYRITWTIPCTKCNRYKTTAQTPTQTPT